MDSTTAAATTKAAKIITARILDIIITSHSPLLVAQASACEFLNCASLIRTKVTLKTHRLKPVLLRQHQRADPVGHLSDGNASNLLHCLHIDRGYRLGPAGGNVDGPAVRRESDPRGSASPGRLSRHRRIGQ